MLIFSKKNIPRPKKQEKSAKFIRLVLELYHFRYYYITNSKREPEDMHLSNSVKVLDAIRAGRDGASRKEIAAQTGLAWGTMYKTVDALLARNLASARESKSAAPGRPSVPLRINPGGAIFCGMDIGSETTRLMFCDLDFKPLVQLREPTERFTGGERFFDRAAELFRRARESGGIAADQVAGIGLSVSGTVDSDAGVIVSGGNFGMRRGADLTTAELSRRLGGIPVFPMTTQAAAVTAEYRFGRRKGCGDLVTVGLGVGIGSGATVNHHLLLSHPKRPVGYIGHILIPGNERLCTCGFRGCLEAWAGGASLAGIAREKFPLRPELHSAAALDHATAAGDSDARAILETAAGYNAAGVAAMIQLYSPEALIFSGGQSREDGFLLRETVRRLHAILPPERRECPVELTILGEFQSALGAARLAYERFL